MNKAVKNGHGLGTKKNPLVIRREWCHFYPEYKRKIFDIYPKVQEIKIWSGWAYGYFGNSFNTYTEIDGIRVVNSKLNDFIFKGINWKEIEQVLKREENK